MRAAPAVAIRCAALALAFACGSGPAHGDDAARISSRLGARLADLPAPPTGILRDRVLPLVALEAHDGRAAAPPVSLAAWRQMADEMRRASTDGAAWPTRADLRLRSQRARRAGRIPLAFLHCRWDRIRPQALHDGTLSVDGGRLRLVRGTPYVEQRLFAAAALVERTHHGEHVVFEIDPGLWLGNAGGPPARLEADFDDGRGFRPLPRAGTVAVRYPSPGRKQVRVRADVGGDLLHAAFQFEVVRLATPAPHDTLDLTAGVPYGGAAGSGRAYVYRADGHATLLRPILVVEGFDLDNSLDWDDLYVAMNQENLLESLRADGYDFVVLDFTDATAPIQRNAYVVAELIQQVQAGLEPGTGMALLGASMGGLVSRFALAHLETSGFVHRVRTFVSADAPHAGANIPLGIQHWLDFFREEAAEADFLLSRLDTPAARQMLVYHHATAPGSTGAGDPLRAELLADLAALGGWPTTPRLVALANGSGAQVDQGFAPGEQILRWDYTSFLLEVHGNVWAVPDGASQRIFQGEIDILFLPADQRDVTVSGTQPYDGAPGGARATMAEMDAVAAPYGDIVALHPSHCFIPTVSALAVDGAGLFDDLLGDPDLLAGTPFDAVYVQAANQPHVAIDAESAAWLRAQLAAPTDAAGDERQAPRAVVLHPAAPNPFNPTTSIRFDLPQAAHVQLSVHDARGARLVTLLDGRLPAGPTRTVWDGRDAAGRRVAAGVYLCRLQVEDRLLACKLTLVP
jgi:hypothetical protein